MGDSFPHHTHSTAGGALCRGKPGRTRGVSRTRGALHSPRGPAPPRSLLGIGFASAISPGRCAFPQAPGLRPTLASSMIKAQQREQMGREAPEAAGGADSDAGGRCPERKPDPQGAARGDYAGPGPRPSLGRHLSPAGAGTPAGPDKPGQPEALRALAPSPPLRIRHPFQMCRPRGAEAPHPAPPQAGEQGGQGPLPADIPARQGRGGGSRAVRHKGPGGGLRPARALCEGGSESTRARGGGPAERLRPQHPPHKYANRTPRALCAPQSAPPARGQRRAPTPPGLPVLRCQPAPSSPPPRRALSPPPRPVRSSALPTSPPSPRSRLEARLAGAGVCRCWGAGRPRSERPPPPAPRVPGSREQRQAPNRTF
ncbi:basic salivary proline-rich protein 2-like [Sarcophilus harrisii]|uniref:basic salivary proline-rich protein 2-like n=1 Tax=Sarcophilus harrisii TaxID=9305 RepID=UPI001301BC6B|nr:basic salivary proline-rich protein 2-like [Sarcophilus harrisii]